MSFHSCLWPIQARAVLEYPAASSRGASGPIPGGRQQVKEEALAGWQKHGLCELFKGKGRNQTQQDESTGRVSEVCCEQLNKSQWFIVPNFSQVLEISGKKKTNKPKHTPKNLHRNGQFWIFYLLFLIHIAYSKGPNQVGGEATVRLCTAEVFRDPGEVLKRHCQASTHLTGLEKKFCHMSPSCPSKILKIKYAVERKISWEAIQKQKKNYPTRLGFVITQLYMGAARKFQIAPISFQRQWVFLSVWPEPLLALILSGRLLLVSHLLRYKDWNPT